MNLSRGGKRDARDLWWAWWALSEKERNIYMAICMQQDGHWTKKKIWACRANSYSLTNIRRELTKKKGKEKKGGKQNTEVKEKTACCVSTAKCAAWQRQREREEGRRLLVNRRRKTDFSGFRTPFFFLPRTSQKTYAHRKPDTDLSTGTPTTLSWRSVNVPEKKIQTSKRSFVFAYRHGEEKKSHLHPVFRKCRNAFLCGQMSGEEKEK